MAKKTKAYDKVQWVAAYKEFVLEHGELPKRPRELAEFSKQPMQALRSKFGSLEQLETAVVLLYFKQAHDLLIADEKLTDYSSKERQLAFLYVLIEKVAEEEDFMQEFYRFKKWDKAFAMRLLRMLNEQDLPLWSTMQMGPNSLEMLGVSPKQMALINHSLSTMVFFLRDTSEEKQDTDAYIEKTTDVLFRLTDTGTFRSVMDLGKFLFSRRKSSFSWE